VLVDVSGSMTDDDRYDKVRSALTGMMDALDPSDHVALVTFSTDAEVVYEGTDKETALAALPPRPTGAKTDIGAGIEAGIAQLRRPGASPSGVLALITDGTIDTADDSPWATPDAPGWATLAEDATALAAEQSVAAYAIALGDETDAGLLGRVFPEARNVPGDEVGPYLGRIDAELLNFQAAEKLRADANGTVTAAWTNLDATGLVTTGNAQPTLTLTSTLGSAPVEVGDLELTLGNGEVTASGLPETVVLGPGESQQFPVAVTVDDLAESGGGLVVRGTVDSPWREAASEFGVALAPRVDSTAVTLTPTDGATASEVLRPWLLPVVGGVVAVLAAVGVLVALLRRRPQLRGAFTIERQGATVREFMLTGPRVDLARAAGPAASGLVGTVTHARTKDAGGVRVNARVGKQKVRTVLRDGDSVNVGDLTLHWTSQRSRTLGMVNEGLGRVDP